MKKMFFASLLLVFVLAFAGCASEAPPTAEPTEPINENTSQEDDTGNQTNAEPSPAVEPTLEIAGRAVDTVVFDTLESFLGNIQRGTLPDGYHGVAAFDLSENRESLMFPTQNREIYPLDRIEYRANSGGYSVVHRLDEEAPGNFEIRSWFDFDNSGWTIHERAEDLLESAGVNFKIFEIINDKYLLTKIEDERVISLSWLGGDMEFGFSVSNWGGRTVDREQFFEIFENFQFVDFATMEQEVLGQSAAGQ